MYIEVKSEIFEGEMGRLYIKVGLHHLSHLKVKSKLLSHLFWFVN
jgi:hypothetical protein